MCWLWLLNTVLYVLGLVTELGLTVLYVPVLYVLALVTKLALTVLYALALVTKQCLICAGFGD